MFEMFRYAFIVRAFAAGLMIALCTALLGVSLVLKRFSMIGDGLAHVAFGALATASVLHLAPMWVAMPVTVICAFMLLRVGENSRLRGDAAIALLSASSLAIGVTVISMTTGMNADLNSYLFGSILAVSVTDVVLCGTLSFAVVTLFAVFYNRVFAVTFDENFARATGLKASAYNAVLALLTAVTIVVGMRLTGTLLMSSLLIFPALTATRVCKTWRSVTIVAAITSVVCFAAGMTASFYLQTPAGAGVVLANLAVFLLAALVGAVKN
jgi:zinc transport system permease protein